MATLSKQMLRQAMPVALLILCLTARTVQAQDVVKTYSEADWAIMMTRVSIEAETVWDGPFQDFVEIWGRSAVTFNGLTMGAKTIGSPNDHVDCSLADLNAPGNPLEDGIAIAIGAAAAVGAIAATVATAGAAAPTIPAVISGVIAATGTGATSIGPIIQKLSSGDSKCEDGTIAHIVYPVSIGADLEPYLVSVNVTEIDETSENDLFHAMGSVGLTQCFGSTFEPNAFTETQSCKNETALFEGDSGAGKVLLETQVVTWMKGPIIDGCISSFRDGDAFTERTSIYDNTC